MNKMLMLIGVRALASFAFGMAASAMVSHAAGYQLKLTEWDVGMAVSTALALCAVSAGLFWWTFYDHERGGIKLLLLLLILCGGCARFTTTQKEVRYDDRNEITTTATAITFLAGKHALANWKATQSEGNQEAAVGSLTQDVEASKELAPIVEALAKGVVSGLKP